MLDNKNLINNLLDDSELDNVLGGVRGKSGKNAEILPQHICLDGKIGDLIEHGYSHSGNGTFRCSLCGAKGKINYLPGTRKYCNLI